MPLNTGAARRLPVPTEGSSDVVVDAPDVAGEGAEGVLPRLEQRRREVAVPQGAVRLRRAARVFVDLDDVGRVGGVRQARDVRRPHPPTAQRLPVEAVEKGRRADGLTPHETLLGQLLEQRADERRRRRLHKDEQRGVGVQHLCVHLLVAVGAVGRHPGEHLEQQQPERPPVDRNSVRLAPHHLWSEVLGRAADGGSAHAAAACAQPLGEAKVAKLDVARAVKKQVLRLEVAVHDAAHVVQVAEHVGDARGVEAGLPLLEATQHVQHCVQLAAEDRL
mmetsp:Transcript_34404/g.102345  ORF Transcript_34404/g.102345 Transcript_34404/m.102345 type:complete len:277 (+) Transcript_34404:251-1081(+)